jgi:uncharacterized SAM-binding protein YcdF (DUF218 family)
LKKNSSVYTLLFLSFLLMITSCAWFRPKPDVLYERALKGQPYDVIIVPGVPFNGKRWDTIMKGRVLWASHLYKKGIAKNIIFSGGAVYTPYVEGKIFALYAEALGVPKENIFVDSIAEHSTENVYYSYQIAKKKGFKKIAVATDPYQSAKLMGFTKRRFKEHITFIPFVEDTLKLINNQNPTIDPSSARVKDFKPITETQSKFYRLKGTLGRNIKYRKEK